MDKGAGNNDIAFITLFSPNKIAGNNSSRSIDGFFSRAVHVIKHTTTGYKKNTQRKCPGL
jgi:hypothetical protein